MPKFFMLGIALFLVLAAAGYGLTTIQARSIPWDCTDWQAFAHADRTTSILESLAENRGKTLYCGVDQSDTFTKAETWEAGKDRNERDDTVYFGERGQFRGFIAAQEGYLTDGESGVTGVSIDRIFEFPREERRRTKRVKRFDVGTDAEQFPITEVASCGEVLGLICPGESNLNGPWVTNQITGGNYARNVALGFNRSTADRHVTWDTNLWYTDTNYNADPRGAASGNASPNNDWWQGQAVAAAERACRARGARYVAGSARLGPGHSENRGAGAQDSGPSLGFFFRRVPHPTSSSDFRYASRQSRTWEATCKKVIRRTRK